MRSAPTHPKKQASLKPISSIGTGNDTDCVRPARASATASDSDEVAPITIRR